MLTNFTQKNPLIFECIECVFKCSNKKDYNRHISTRKHKMLTNVDAENANYPNKFVCECGKKYNHRQSLFVHKKKCKKNDEENMVATENSDLSDKEIIKMLIKENSEFKTMILDVVKTIQPNNTTNNNNCHNTTNNFNLQFFLNNTCKDAINLVDFVEGLQVKLKDLEETARLGYSEGVSNIFINGLNELEVNKRPIHCSDSKRETLYIKDQNEWVKEDPLKTHLTKAIKTVSKKNIQQIFEWQKKYPEYNDPDSKHNDKYLNMVSNAMSGSTDQEQCKNIEKIISNIAKEVIIDKNI
jgi:hypothetical protein